MRVLHVISGLSRNSGGPARSAQGLVAAECAANIDALICPMDGSEPWLPGVRRFNQKITQQTIRQFDLIHIHGIWNWSLHQVAVICQKAKAPYVIAPRGMLEPWSLRQKWVKKRLARFAFQDRDLRKAAALHATAESEAEQFRRLGFKNKVIVSPNGVNVPTGKVEKKGGGGRRRALFVSRMHPKKGVLELIESWARVKPKDWLCELVYTMNSDEERAYEQKVKDRILTLGMSYQDKDGNINPTTTTSDSDFLFTGPLDDVAKWDAYARADLFVLPTYSENFGIVVAEALWAGVPVITTKGTPWGELECSASSKFKVQSSRLDERCGWWIDLPPIDSLDKALREAIEVSNNPNVRTVLSEMGQRGHQLVSERYTWSAAGDEMVRGYEEVLR